MICLPLATGLSSASCRHFALPRDSSWDTGERRWEPSSPARLAVAWRDLPPCEAGGWERICSYIKEEKSCGEREAASGALFCSQLQGHEAGTGGQ